MTALPTVADAKLSPNLPNVISAYEVCRRFESASSDKPDDLMRARILGYLIIHTSATTTSEELSEVIRVIHSCNGDNANLSGLGASFLKWFIHLFRKSTGRTPAPSDHPSRNSFDVLKQSIKKEILEAPKDHTDAKNQALIRDGYRCVVTGLYDMRAAEFSISVEEAYQPGFPVHTQCAHIIPESTYFGVKMGEVKDNKLDYSASVLAVLQRFGYDTAKINGPKVHSLYNVMTMQADVHDSFDRLEISFEKLEGENHYRVCPHVAMLSPRFNDYRITFTTPDPINLPVPSEKLLGLHHACCVVARLSGAAEYIENSWRDDEELRELAEDGGSASALSNALFIRMGSLINVGA